MRIKNNTTIKKKLTNTIKKITIMAEVMENTMHQYHEHHDKFASNAKGNAG